MNRLRAECTLCCVLLLWGPLAAAENADRNKPIDLASDHVLVDETNQVSVFDGKVELNQGTLRIQAAKIVLTQDKEGYKHCTATGNPASFRQKREGVDEYVEGYGDRIEYDTRAETVDFYGHARVKRNFDEVRGDHIAYSTRTEVYQVSSVPGVVDDASGGRVRAVIQPRQNPASATVAAPPLSIQTTPTLSAPNP